MLRQIIVIFSGLFCLYLLPLAAAHAETPATALRNQAQQHIDAAPKRGALFKITKANHTAYLFGTIHVGMADFYPLEATVMQALSQASKIALEIDPLNTGGAQAAMRRHGLYPSGQTLNLQPSQKTRLTEILKTRGMSYESVASMKPWLAATMLTLNEFSAQGFQSSLAVDSFIAGFARAGKIPLVELESIEGQIALFGALTEAEQLRYLDDAMKEIEDTTGIEKIAHLTRLWRTADIAGIDDMAAELAADPTFSGKFFQKMLLDRRNPGLAAGIEKLLKSETRSFAGIGMFHLVGKQSVPAILKQRGYAVQRIY